MIIRACVVLLFLFVIGCATSSVRDPAMIGGFSVIHKSEVFFGHCTGTMIAPHIILTAGHCVYSYKESRELGFFMPDGQDLMINGYTKKNSKETFIVEVSNSFVHPSWRKALQNPQKSSDVAADKEDVSDVGVIILKQKLPLDVAVLPAAQLWDNLPDDTIGVAVFGGGCTRRGDDLSSGNLKGALYNQLKVHSYKVLLQPFDALTGAAAGPCKKDSGGGGFLVDDKARTLDNGPVVGVASIMAGTAAEAMQAAPTGLYLARIDRPDVLEWIRGYLNKKVPSETAVNLTPQ